MRIDRLEYSCTGELLVSAFHSITGISMVCMDLRVRDALVRVCARRCCVLAAYVVLATESVCVRRALDVVHTHL